MAERAERPRREVSDTAVRAQRLLVGGLVGGHVAALVAVGLFWARGGVAAGASAAVAAAATLAFYTIGLAVQVAVADAPAKRVLVVTLASYGFRVGVLGLVLGATLAAGERVPWLDPTAVVVTTVAVVVGWLTLEVWTYTRLRIPVYDPPDAPRRAPESM